MERIASHPRLPFTLTSLARGAGGGVLGKHSVDGIVRTGDDMGADDFATGIGDGGRSGIDGGLDGGDIAGDDGVAHRVADLLHRTNEFDVCGFEHRIDADDEAGEAAGFEESYCLFGHGGFGVC